VSERLTRHWQDDPRKKVRRRGFEVQEKRAAEAHGGALTRGSGCSRRPSQKGDSVSEYFRVSSKTTEKPGAKSIRIERSWLTEIDAQARSTGHRPVLNFGFSPDAANPTREDWAGYPLQVAGHLMQTAVLLLQGNVEEATAHAELALGVS
jgi:hypothetical protein